MDEINSDLHIPTEAERIANHQALAKLHRGNRFRLMFGLPLLPEPLTTPTTMPNTNTTPTPPTLVKGWEDLALIPESDTHRLEINIEHGNGWIHLKAHPEFSFVHGYYLSTHTFYGKNHENSTKQLQKRGFNVVCANWDAVPEITRSSQPWDYCPECGSEEHQPFHEYTETHRSCNDCGQDWHTDVDYSNAVKSNLAKAIKEIKAFRTLEK